jgi:tRNA modification GTPase
MLQSGDVPVNGDAVMVSTSTVVPDGLDELRRALPAIVLDGGPTDGFVVSNTRHAQSLTRASQALRNALKALDEGVPLDLVSLDTRQSLDALSSITGADIGEDVLDRVFSNFCIGK